MIIRLEAGRIDLGITGFRPQHMPRGIFGKPPQDLFLLLWPVSWAAEDE